MATDEPRKSEVQPAPGTTAVVALADDVPARPVDKLSTPAEETVQVAPGTIAAVAAAGGRRSENRDAGARSEPADDGEPTRTAPGD